MLNAIRFWQQLATCKLGEKQVTVRKEKLESALPLLVMRVAGCVTEDEDESFRLRTSLLELVHIIIDAPQVTVGFSPSIYMNIEYL